MESRRFTGRTRSLAIAAAVLFLIASSVAGASLLSGDSSPSGATAPTASNDNLATTAAPNGAVSAVAAASTSSPTTAPTTSGKGQQEAQQFSGNVKQINDAQATNGTAVVINQGGTLTQTASLPPGAYMMNARVRSAGIRVGVGVGGKSIGTAMLTGDTWQTVSAPVRITGTPVWGVMAMGRTDGGPNQPLYVDWLSLTPASFGYSTIGNQIIDPTAKAVTPRGVDRDGFQFKPQGTYYISDNDFQAMYLWGATIVRLPLDEQQWLSSSCFYDPTYAQRVDAAVQSITRRGMIALLTLQHTSDGNPCAQSYLSSMADDRAPQYWTEVASRYKSNPLVAFDLYNEPKDISIDVWHDGGMVGTWHAVGMQQLYNTVRATGANNLVFVSGIDTAYNVSVALRRPVDGYGIVYAPHVYKSPGLGPLPVDIDKVIPPVAAQYPLVITEFGTVSGTPLYNTNAINWAESHGVGWLAWKWYQVPSQYALLASFVTYTPSPAGQPVRDALWKARGWTTYGH
jgi:endoglucanase